jgi:signal transduction histidine kinase
LSPKSVAIFLAIALAACYSAPPKAERRANRYLYEDTRRLVNFVEAAAARIEQRGTDAFKEFDVADSQWQTAPTYLFVFDAGGTCVWHGLNRELVGQNLLNLRDALGKPVIKMVTNIGKRPRPDAADWVFYLWEERVDFAPTWKSSYIRKAVAPGGKVYLVGSGSGTIKVEKIFLKEAVDAAAGMLQRRGREIAFRDLREPSSRFQFLGSYIFVLDDKGKFLIDPGYPTLAGRDMSGFRDAIGRPVVQQLLEQLKTSDSAWSQFLWPKPGEVVLSRKMMYVRKVNCAGETLLVGSDFFVATPVWMRL